MKLKLERYWPSLIVAACITYLVGVFVLALGFWVFAPRSPALDGLVNTTQLLFPSLLVIVLTASVGPWLGVGVAFIIAMLTLWTAFTLNRKSLKLGVGALVVYLALSAWLHLSRMELYALAGVTQR